MAVVQGNNGGRDALYDALVPAIPAIAAELATYATALPGYRAETEPDRRAEDERLIVIALDAWRRELPIASLLELWMTVAGERAASGISSQIIVQMIKRAVDGVWRAAADAVDELDLPPALFREFTDWILHLSTALMSVSADPKSPSDGGPLDLIARRRFQFWDDIAHGRLTESDATGLGDAIALDVRRPYLPFQYVGPASDLTSSATVLAKDGDVAHGVTAAAEMMIAGSTSFAGVGPAVPLWAMRDAIADARRALAVAMAFRMPGSHSLESLGVRVAVFEQPDVGERLIRKYLDPLAALGSFATAVEQSLDAYFDCDRRVDTAARMLKVHHNTLRHRLRRFEQLTGADVQRSETALEVWWAIEARRLRRDA
jgi:DNA-binding PucR family transcriptional regulator